MGEGEFASRRAELLPAKAALTSPGNALTSTTHFVDYAGSSQLCSTKVAAVLLSYTSAQV